MILCLNCEGSGVACNWCKKGKLNTLCRKFVVHCKKSSYDVYIGRPGPWGNNWSHLPESAAEFRTETREEAIEKHREWVLSQPELINKIKQELKGKILGCWCRPYHHDCHGDILADIANE